MTPQTDLMALAREIGTVRDVAARRYVDGNDHAARDHHQMLARLDDWRARILAALAGAETPQGMERYAEVSRHELRADGFLAYVFRRFEQQHPPPFGDGGNLIMLWRRDFAPPPAVAPPALVALVREWQRLVNGYEDGTHDLAGLDVEMRRVETALRDWTPDAAAPPVAEEAPYCERHGVMCALDEMGRQWSCDCQTAEPCPCGSGYVYTPNHATHAPPALSVDDAHAARSITPPVAAPADCDCDAALHLEPKHRPTCATGAAPAVEG